MKKEKRLRRRIEKEEEPEEMDDSNTSPVRCVDCDKKYPLIVGSSTIRCKSCNETFKIKTGYYK